jgi:bacteriorhodopsin
MTINTLIIFLQNQVEMADTLRQDGKFWVVIAVIMLVLFGIFFYLLRIDRKLSKLEK